MMIWLILGMFLVTYLPRLLPMVLTRGLTFPPLLERWLGFVPFAALGALIFPGVLTVQPDQMWIGFLGALAAFLVSWWAKNMILVLVSAILAVYVLQQM